MCGQVFAFRWANQQVSRLLAFHQAYRRLLFYYFAIFIGQVVATFLYPDAKAEAGVPWTIMFMLGAERGRKRLVRWVKRPPKLLVS
jgi:uncharacterized protein (DUF3084 family)